MKKQKRKEDNLHPFGTRAEDVERAVRSKGGYARAEKLREEKTIRGILKIINEENVDVMIDGKMVRTLRKVKPILALQAKAEEGDVQAIREWAKLQGEYTTTINVGAESAAPLSLGNIAPEALALFILDAQRKKR